MQKLYLLGLVSSPMYNMFGTDDSLVTAKKVTDFLGGLQPNEEFEVYINSPGGDCFEGLSIYNLLSEHASQMTVKIIGEASSIASVITCAGAKDKVLVAETALGLIHKPWTFAFFDEDYLKELEKQLVTVKESIITAYQRKTGLNFTELNDMMTAGEYLNAKDLVKNGFADKVWIPSEVESTQADQVKQKNMQIVNKAFFSQVIKNPEYPVRLAALAFSASSWKLNSKCVTNAKKLINNGDYDATSSWSMTPADEDKILGNPPDYKKYAQWHLGNDDSLDQQTKQAYSYPVGKNDKVYKRALVAIEGYATKNNETEIHDAAANLIKLIDDAEANKTNNKSSNKSNNFYHLYKGKIMNFNSLEDAVNYIGRIEPEFEALKATAAQTATELLNAKNQLTALETSITEKDTAIADMKEQNFVHEAKAFCEEMFNAKKLTRAEINGSADLTKELPAKVTKLVDLRKADEKLYTNECEDIKNRSTVAMDYLGPLPAGTKTVASGSWTEKFLARIKEKYS